MSKVTKIATIQYVAHCFNCQVVLSQPMATENDAVDSAITQSGGSLFPFFGTGGQTRSVLLCAVCFEETVRFHCGGDEEP